VAFRWLPCVRAPFSRLLGHVEAGQERGGEQAGVGSPPGLDLDGADRRPVGLTGRAEGQIGVRRRLYPIGAGAAGWATPIIESRVISAASPSSPMPSVPAGRRGITR